jgi:hypothetical protein
VLQRLIDRHLKEISTLGNAADLGEAAQERPYRAYRMKSASGDEGSDAFLQDLEKALDLTLVSAPRITLSPGDGAPLGDEAPSADFGTCPILSDAVAKGLKPGVIADVTHYIGFTPERPSVLSEWHDKPDLSPSHSPLTSPALKFDLRSNIDMDGNVFGGFGGGGFGGGGLGGPTTMYREVDVDGDGKPEKVPFYRSFPTPVPGNAGGSAASGTLPGARISVFPSTEHEWSGLWQAVAVEPSEDDKNGVHLGTYAVYRQKRKLSKGHLFWRKTTVEFAETAWQAELDIDLTHQPLFLIGKGAWPGEYQIVKVSVIRIDGGQGQRFYRIDGNE